MTIEGWWDDTTDATVTVDGVTLLPGRSQQVLNHSPDGFAWGYGGSGPAQLALAILLHAGLDQDKAIALHQAFKWQYITPLPLNGQFSLDVDVDAWAKHEWHISER